MYKRISPILIIAIFYLFFNPFPSEAQWPVIRTDADSLVRIGMQYVYNVQFNEGERAFRQVMEKYPEHPAGYFLDAMVDWWKITLYSKRKDFDDSFLKKIDKVISVCDRILDTSSINLTAMFFKAGALGYRGRFYAQNKNWFPAANDANNAVNILIECLKIAPNNYDIMLGTGLYNYFSEVLPKEYPALKPLMLFLPKGDKQIGLLQLKAAASNSMFAYVEAKVVLLQVYYSYEKNYDECLKLSLSLHETYPNNAYFYRYLGRCYVTTGQPAKWEQTWRQILLRYIDKQPGYDEVTAREALYYIGYALMMKKDYKMALKYFIKCDEACRAVDEEITGFMVAANLKMGNIYDAQGNRNEAIRQYKKVLSMEDHNNSHNEASRYMEHPYRN
jgi:tetratricopeptide (TPR) repeat protein